MSNLNKVVRAVIYARCSTDENKQDVEVQLKELRRYCEAFGWEYDEVFEYGSAYKGDQPELEKVIEKIRRKHYDVLVVFSMDRFSREHPSKINSLLDQIVENYGCRFIAIQQGIDSENEMIWHAVKPLFVYFANKYSRDLGEKIRLGIQRKKAAGKYCGGRPSRDVDVNKIVALRAQGMGYRGIAGVLNEGAPTKSCVSFGTVRRVLQKQQEICV
jgi:DNA invertase Pin-like site-specific DNA recombinase